MDTKIYVMTHKRIAKIPNEIYVPLQVGKEGKEDFGYLGDNEGDNISEKNSSYCELTGMYWLWKHVKCDIIGICHYRRYFVRDEDLLDQAYIEKRIAEYPIIIPSTGCVREASVYAQYEKIHNSGKDLDICRDVIAEKYPEYLQAFDIAMQSVLVSVGNMWITKKDIYDRYCEWLFDILFEAEKRIDTTGYDTYQKRVMGFLSERLFRVWLMMQPEKITEENVKMLDPEDFGKEQKKSELISQYLKIKLEPVLSLYKDGKPTGTLAGELACADDFEGKIPVWVCVWQGIDGLSETSRLCYESIVRNIPKEQMVLRVITLENCLSYVSFTDSVIRKFNEGLLSLEQLADCLQAELLYRYGGIWLDTDTYVSKSLTVVAIGAKHILYQFGMEALWYYWEIENKAITDKMLMHVLTWAVELFPGEEDVLRKYQSCFDGTELLKCILGKKATEERMKWIADSIELHQLDGEKTYQKENMAGERTVYGALCEES